MSSDSPTWGWLGINSWISSPTSSASMTESSANSAAPSQAQATATDYLWGTISSVSSSLRGFVEQEKNILAEENKKSSTKPVQIPVDDSKTPWEAGSLSPTKTAQLKHRILALCRSKRNFLDPPPPDANFSFDYDASLPTILACLKADTNLQKMRFWAVPQQINEKDFWRNYFYRISMIKEAYGVGQKQLPQTPSKPLSASSSGLRQDSKFEDLDDFISDASAAQGTEVSFDSSLEEEIEAELKGSAK